MALEVFSDMSERLNYNVPGFPIYARKGELRHFDRYAAACHWHPDLEFILILNGTILRLKPPAYAHPRAYISLLIFIVCKPIYIIHTC